MDNLPYDMKNRYDKSLQGNRFPSLFIGIMVLVGLYLISLVNYLLFHFFAEIFCVVVVACIFILTWYVRNYLTNNYLKIIGFCYGFIAVVNLFHALTYGGITILSGYGTNQSIQFWMAEAYLLSITILTASFLIGSRRLSDYCVIGCFIIVTFALLIAIFLGIFPDCYIEGKGLTPFKVFSEYAIIAVLIASLFPLYRRRDQFDRRVFILIFSSMLFTMISEIFFSGYRTLFDSANQVGHLLKVAAFFLIFQAILVTGLRKPYNIIFRDLKQTEDQLHRANETLEQKVIERTTELAQTNRELLNEITERKHAEDSLRKSESLLNAVQKLAKVGGWEYNVESGKSFWTDELYDIHEIPNDLAIDHINESIKCYREEDRPVILEAFQKACEKGEPYDLEFPFTTFKERHLWIRTIVQPVHEEDKVVRLIGNVMDITERKLAETEVERLKNYLGNIFNSMPSVLVGMDRDEVVTQWNRQAEEMTDIPSAQAVGKPITQLFPDFSSWIAGMRDDIEKRRPSSMEKVLIEKGGMRLFYDLMMYPLITNCVEGAVLRIEDITEQTRIQELMVQTEKMMSLGGLAAGMAHEINNPLGIITQAAQNIERRVLSDLPANREAAEEIGISLEGMKAYFQKRQITEFIGSLREASGRASRIITNILRFSRGAETTLQPGSLAGILEQALELAASDYDLKKKYDFRSIEILRDYARDLPEIPMAPVEMEQVILNLLKNAAHAMIENPPDRNPGITLRLRREERWAVIEVEDNGPGMTEEIRRRVFEPFFTTKEPGIGTGLGLSVGYMIVTQNHKGLMEAASIPGNGARFTIRLPLSQEDMHE